MNQNMLLSHKNSKLNDIIKLYNLRMANQALVLTRAAAVILKKVVRGEAISLF
jgi:hypothetical protein